MQQQQPKSKTMMIYEINYLEQPSDNKTHNQLRHRKKSPASAAIMKRKVNRRGGEQQQQSVLLDNKVGTLEKCADLLFRLMEATAENEEFRKDYWCLIARHKQIKRLLKEIGMRIVPPKLNAKYLLESLDDTMISFLFIMTLSYNLYYIPYVIQSVIRIFVSQ